LRQLVEAGAAHEVADERQHQRVVIELEEALPFGARLGD
jgi:hypothetical protein